MTKTGAPSIPGPKRPFYNKLPLYVRNGVCLIFFFILAAVLFVAPYLAYASKTFPFSSAMQSVFALLIAAAIAGCAVLCLSKALLGRGRARGSLDTRRFRIGIMLSTVLLLAIQMYIVVGSWFEAGWDVAALTGNVSDDFLASYLSNYPNQVFLYSLFRGISVLGGAVGIQDGYLALVVGSCCCVSISLALMADVARILFGIRIACFSYAVGFFYLGLSPWILVPYSDTYAMLFPILALWCYVAMRRRGAQGVCIAVAVAFGYMVKPTTIFIGLSILMIELYNLLKNRQLSVRRVGHIACVILVGIACAGGLGRAASAFAPPRHDEQALGMTHFLMMGANAEGGGIFSDDDVAYSLSFATKSERTQANLKRWVERVADLGPAGLAKLGLEKTMTNFADGTFAWKVEGGFIAAEHGDNDFVKDWYGIDSSPEWSGAETLFRWVSQAAWMLILLGVSLGLVRSSLSDGEFVAYLSLLMLAVFLLLFEARTRYLLLYAPYFVMLGTAGFIALCDKVGASVYATRSHTSSSSGHHFATKKSC